MKTRFALLVLAILAAAGTAGAQFWEKKEWAQWSKEDARKMLEDSPWAKTWRLAENRELEFGQSTQGTGRESRPEIYYDIQLRSALPVRAAVIRQMQLSGQYAKMSETDKKAFEQSGQAYLSKTYDDVIVVHVIYGSNVQIMERALARLWQSFPSGTVPINTYLSVGAGKKIAPIQMISPPGGAYEFELIFPRTVQNEPVIGPNDKAIRIEFPTPSLDDLGAARSNRTIENTNPSSHETFETTRLRAFAEFKFDKMQYKGKLEY